MEQGKRDINEKDLNRIEDYEHHRTRVVLYNAIHKFEKIVSCINEDKDIPKELNLGAEEFDELFGLLDGRVEITPPGGHGRLSEWYDTFIQSGDGYSFEPNSLIFAINGECVEIEKQWIDRESENPCITQIIRGKNDILNNHTNKLISFCNWYGGDIDYAELETAMNGLRSIEKAQMDQLSNVAQQIYYTLSDEEEYEVQHMNLEAAVKNALKSGTTKADISMAKDEDRARKDSIEIQIDEQE